jgi:hypothetical protein
MQQPEKPPLSDAPTAELGFALPEPTRLSRGRALLLGGVGALLLGGVFLLVAVPRKAARADLARETASASKAAETVAHRPHT